MGEVTKIAWTDATFNPWLGCQKVSPGCTSCYAETLVTGRMRLPVWGPPKTTERKRTSAANWREPLRWNKRAAANGVRERVFCASLADVFEDHPMVAPWREELFAMIEQTPALDWLLLTKRPENLLRTLPTDWLEEPRPNVWLGTTVEDQRRADERIPHLLATPAAVRFLSCEPLLEAVALSPYLVDDLYRMGRASRRTEIDWVIVGGESGPGARPFDLAWARSIVRECRDAGVACFVKQMGARPIDSDRADIMNERGGVAYVRPHGHADIDEAARLGRRILPHDVSRFLSDRKGGDPAEWPADLRVQQFPEARHAD